MMTSRLYSWNNVAGYFQTRRGFGTIWLIAAIGFVIVFLGISFLLLRDKTSHQKPAIVQAAFKSEIREPIKANTALNKAPVETEKPEQKPAVALEKDFPEKDAQTAKEPSNGDPSRIQEVLPDDPPGKGILSQDLNQQEQGVLPEAQKSSDTPASPPAVEPTLVAADSELADMKSQVKDKKPISGSLSAVSAPAQKPPAKPPERPAGDKKKTAEEGLEELTVTVIAGNVRQGPSVKEAVVFRVAGGDRVQMTGQKGNWYAVRRSDGQAGWAHHTLFKASSPPSAETKTAASESGQKGVIKGIRTVVTDPNQAQIIFELNGYHPPEIMVIEGEVPRVVCDFFSARLAPGVKKSFSVKTGIVKRIRVGVHKGSKPKVRVVLDLNAGQNYAVEQFFFEKENYYALMVNSAR